jgi:diguanylate cyclase (GGDEF)-like protein
MIDLEMIGTILYVEDEDEIRNELSEVLQMQCQTLLVAKNGQEGLDLYSKHDVDIVVSDIKMPVMDGISMARKIKQRDDEACILFTTAFNDTIFMQEAIELQVDGYILKPIDIDVLQKKLNSLIRNHHMQQRLLQQEALINEIASMQDNMVIALDENHKLIFGSYSFLEFLDINGIDDFYDRYACVSQLFLKSDEYFHTDGFIDPNWAKNLMNLDDDKRVVLMINLGTLLPIPYLVSVKYIQNNCHTIVSFVEISNITLEKHSLKNRVYKDTLTGVFNRLYFEKELSLAIKNRDDLTLMILDIDFFKKVNDTYGHQIGDKILVEFAHTISNSIRLDDLFARWGGEEFVLLIKGISIENANKLAQNLINVIEKHIFINKIRLTCSIGVSKLLEKENAEELVHRADKALYEAKNSGRNCTVSCMCNDTK